MSETRVCERHDFVFTKYSSHSSPHSWWIASLRANNVRTTKEDILRIREICNDYITGKDTSSLQLFLCDIMRSTTIDDEVYKIMDRELQKYKSHNEKITYLSTTLINSFRSFEERIRKERATRYENLLELAKLSQIAKEKQDIEFIQDYNKEINNTL